MSKIKLLSFDLDGTAIDNGWQFTPRNLEVLEKAHRGGIILAVNTGRAYPIVPLPVKEPPMLDWLICGNGAQLVRDGQVVSADYLPDEAAARIVTLFGAVHSPFSVWHDDMCYFSKEFSAVMHRHSDDEREKGIVIGAAETAEDILAAIRERRKPVVKVDGSWEGVPDWPALVRALEDVPGTTVCTPSPGHVEITASGVNKGAGLQALARRLKLPREQIMGIGDSKNDLPMRPACGIFVAMGNADDEVKAAADQVTGSIWEDGFARAIETLVL